MAAALAAASLTASAGPWSLDSCISYAHANNITVRQRAVDRLNAEYGVTEAKDRFLPQVAGGASQNFAFGRGLTGDNTYANRNTQSFGVNVGLSMPIFQGLAGVRRLDYAKANLQAIVEQFEATKDDVTLNVISQYLQVLYCKEMVEVSADQAALSRTELERRRELCAAGKIAELDVLEAEAQLARDELTLVNAENDRDLAFVAIRPWMQTASRCSMRLARWQSGRWAAASCWPWVSPTPSRTVRCCLAMTVAPCSRGLLWWSSAVNGVRRAAWWRYRWVE